LADKPTGYTELMRTFSLLFAFIALVLLAQFLDLRDPGSL
jgi:hypothetical protein